MTVSIPNPNTLFCNSLSRTANAVTLNNASDYRANGLGLGIELELGVRYSQLVR